MIQSSILVTQHDGQVRSADGILVSPAPFSCHLLIDHFRFHLAMD